MGKTVLILLLVCKLVYNDTCTVGILHDESSENIHSFYEPSKAAAQLLFRDIQSNPHCRITAQNTDGRRISRLKIENVSHIVVLASCKESQRIIGNLDPKSATKPILVLSFEYCSIPSHVTSIYLKLAQDCPTCFQRLMVNWLNNGYSPNLRVKYNGDQLSLLHERNLAAKQYLQRQSFIVTTVQFSPLVDIVVHQDGTLGAKGMYMDFLNSIAQAIKVNYTLAFPANPRSTASAGGLENGTWTGLSGMVYRREVDCNLYMYASSRERNRDMDMFTSAASVISIAILIPAPDFPHNISALLKPFDSTVWILLVIAAFLTAAALGFLNPKGNRCANYGEQVLTVFQLLWSQGSESPVKHLQGRLIICAWSIVALVCGYVYTSTLTSYITIPKPQPAVDSIADLAYKKPLETIVFGWGIYNNLFGKASEGPFLALREHLAQHPENVVADFREGVRKVRSGDHAFLGALALLRNLIDEDYGKTRRCTMSVARQPVSMELVTWLFPKNSATSLIFNLWFLRVVDYGLQDFMTEAYKLGNKYCHKYSDFIQPTPLLSLNRIRSAFLILGVGLPLSVIIFLVEHMLHVLSQHRSTLGQLGQVSKSFNE